jgi:hypothetical protein
MPLVKGCVALLLILSGCANSPSFDIRFGEMKGSTFRG